MFLRQSDLALNGDPARRLLPWLVAMIVYLAGLSLAGMMSLGSAVERWDTGLKGTVTVQVPPGNSRASDTAMKKLIPLLTKTPGVISARTLGKAETAALLEPWLGQGALGANLPLPQLIDVKVGTDPGPDLKALAAALSEAVPGTMVDDHQKSLNRLITFARAIELVAITIVILVALAAVVTVVFITRTGLAIHHEGIELLHLMGAFDGYVSRQFQGEALGLGLKGGAIGLALTAVTVAALSHIAGAVGAGLLPRLDLSLGQWLALAGVPLGVTAIIMITTHVTVLGALKKLP
jgi:cell division transport system permease protein